MNPLQSNKEAADFNDVEMDGVVRDTMPRRNLSKKPSTKRLLSSRRLGSTRTLFKGEDEFKMLQFEFEKLQEQITTMNEELVTAGVLEKPVTDGEAPSFLMRASNMLSGMVSKSLYKSFGWKGALAVTLGILLVHVLFIGIYTRIVVTKGCETNVQLVDSKMWDAVTSREGHDRHICSLEMLSMRSEMYSKSDWDRVEKWELPEDRECHLIQPDHALIKTRSGQPLGFPSVSAHDFVSAAWYPCMFERMTCDDIADVSLCGSMDMMINACKNGWIKDSNSKFSKAGGAGTRNIGPYRCDIAPEAPNATETMEYRFKHFKKCSGLVSTVFVDCPHIGNTLGAAEGLAALFSAVVSTLVVVPLTLYWQSNSVNVRSSQVLVEL